MDSAYKICVIGMTSAGKTSLIRRLVEDIFDIDEKPTISHNNFDIELPLPDGSKINLRLADRGGEGANSTSTQTFYLGVDAILQVFAKNDSASLDSLEELNQEAVSQVKHPDQIVWSVVGTKGDTESETNIEDLNDEVVDDEELIFESVSAKEGTGVLEMFQKLAMKIRDNQ